MIKACSCLALIIGLAGCGDASPSKRDQALRFAQNWFQQASNGAREDSLCHGLGLLKHPQFTCAQYLEHAANIDSATREVASIKIHDSFGDTPGEYFELYFLSIDKAGNNVEESLLLRRDDGTFRTYWYRTDSLLALIAPASNDEDEGKDPLQVAYDEIVARYPSLYQYPPCYQIRPTSSNLVGEITPVDALEVGEIDALAASCGSSFCFALVGTKVATLCP